MPTQTPTGTGQTEHLNPNYAREYTCWKEHDSMDSCEYKFPIPSHICVPHKLCQHPDTSSGSLFRSMSDTPPPSYSSLVVENRRRNAAITRNPHIPHPDVFRVAPPLAPNARQRAHVVTRGLEVGVFRDW